MPIQPITPRQRVLTALSHTTPDRAPVDFLAAPEVWQQLVQRLQIEPASLSATDTYDPSWEAVLQHLEVDCRVISYDQFCQPPSQAILPGARVNWFGSLGRSTPNRMWRLALPEGKYQDIWGRQTQIVPNPAGAYEEISSHPLAAAGSTVELRAHPWPEPDWWNFDSAPAVLHRLDPAHNYHLRYRIGSVFETAWQLRGLQAFLRDLALEPAIPLYIMEKITEILVEITHRLLRLAGDAVDMLYFYDDVATQQSLMISPRMWQKYIRPFHQRLVDVAHAYGKPVMYHCDGAIYPLIPALIDLGVTVLNPIQADAKDMQPERLKREFGGRLCFHGGVDIIETLPRGSRLQVQAEVGERLRVLGENGGYILASSHHIQAGTPLDNIFAMYTPDLR